MADKRKNNGGARKGAGRPKKEHSQEMINNIGKAIAKVYGGDYEFWLDTAQKSKEDYRQRKLICDYYYGKPIEQIDHTTNGNDMPAVIEIREIKPK